MSKLRTERKGDQIRLSGGFPMFFGNKRKNKVITSNVWAFLKEKCEEKFGQKAKKPHAFIEQAYDFYLSASNPRLSSRPLLYYYAFLNMVKTFLLLQDIDLAEYPKHGISPVKIKKKKLRFEGQMVKMEQIASDHSQIFPEFLRQFQNCPIYNKPIRIVDLLGQIPAIHRTYCLSKGKCSDPAFCPTRSIQLMKDKDAVWAKMVIDKKDRDVEKTLSAVKKNKTFKETFEQVKPLSEGMAKNCYIFETTAERYIKRGIDSAISKIAKKIRRCGVWSIITPSGYRYYLNNSKGRTIIPQLCAMYAIMFYLGSITRYRPDEFDTIFKGHSWLISDFIDTAPEQFIYLLASIIAETEVVVPHALQNTIV